MSAGCNFSVLGLCNFDVDGLPFAFSALREPSTEAFGEPLRRDTKARFDPAFSNGQGVVKLGGIRKVAHAELIEPFQRTGAALTANDYIDSKLLRVHARYNNKDC